MNILEIYNLLINHIDKIYVGISLIFCIYWILSKIFNFKTIDDQIFKNTKTATKNPLGYKDKTMLSNLYKDWWCYLIEPTESALIRNNVSPNLLTVLSLFFSIITSIMYFYGFILKASIFLLAGSTFDMLDGRIARKTGKQSDIGSFLDSVLDRLCESVILIGIFLFYFPNPFCIVVLIAAIFSLTVSYVKSAADNLNLSSNVGLMQRADRVVYLGLGGIINSIFSHFDLIIFNEENFIFKATIILIATFSFSTTIQRILFAIKK